MELSTSRRVRMSPVQAWKVVLAYIVATAVLTVLVAGLFAGTASASAGYGVATIWGSGSLYPAVANCSNGTFPCTGIVNAIAPYNSSYFSAFNSDTLQRSSPRSYIRLAMPWDSFMTYSGSGCVKSSFFSAADSSGQTGLEIIEQTVYAIQWAESHNLIPEIVVGSGGLTADGPQNPLPAYGNATTYFAGYTNAGLDYYCGVYGLVTALKDYLGSAAPTYWEAWNEPDIPTLSDGTTHLYGDNPLTGVCNNTASTGYCGGKPDTGTGSPCGSQSGSGTDQACGELEAGVLWELFQGLSNTESWNLQIAADSQSHAENSTYEVIYATQLNAIWSCASGYAISGCVVDKSLAFPVNWAVHDYNDVATEGVQDLSTFESELAGLDLAENVWVTESGSFMGAVGAGPDYGDYNISHISCTPLSPPTGDSQAPANSTWCLLDGNPADQYNGATVWLNSLPKVAANSEITTTQLYWFGFQATEDFDSGLLDQNGYPRESFCAVVAAPTADCTGSPWYGTAAGNGYNTVPADDLSTPIAAPAGGVSDAEALEADNAATAPSYTPVNLGATQVPDPSVTKLLPALPVVTRSTFAAAMNGGAL